MTALRSVLALVALATPALAAPKIEPVIDSKGIALAGDVRGGAFCDQARRAVMWLDSGDVVAIDRKGVVTPIGSLGRPTGFINRIVCDQKNRVIAIDRDGLAILEAGTTQHARSTTPLAHLGMLADGRIAVLDRDGAVSTWNGTFTASWKTAAPVPNFGPVQWAPDGSAIAFSQRGAINVVDSQGLRVGPQGFGALWEGDTLVVASLKHGLARWKPTDKPDDVDVIDAQAKGANMYWAGGQLVQQLGPTATVRVLAAPPVAPVTLTRWPSGAFTVATGNAPFMVIAGSRTAYVVDLTRDNAIVPVATPHSPITDMVFSPDGKQLAVTGGDAVLVAKLGTKTIERREYPSSIFAPRLFWDAKGLLAVFLQQRVRWTGGGRDVQPVADRNSSLDDQGNPIDVSALCKNAFGTRVWKGYAAARCGTKVSFGPVGKASVFSTQQMTSAFAIAGAAPQLVYADGQKLMSVSGDGAARELGKVATGFVSAIAASPDGKRLAIVHGESITIWDLERGQLMTGSNPGGRMARVAWSPEGGRIAVANGTSVSIWRL